MYKGNPKSKEVIKVVGYTHRRRRKKNSLNGCFLGEVMKSRDNKTKTERRGIINYAPEGRTGRLPKRLLTSREKVWEFQRGLF